MQFEKINCSGRTSSKVFLYYIAFVTTADDKVVYSVVGIGLHDVPQNRFIADLNHRFGSNSDLFADSRSQTTGQNDYFHIEPPK